MLGPAWLEQSWSVTRLLKLGPFGVDPKSQNLRWKAVERHILHNYAHFCNQTSQSRLKNWVCFKLNTMIFWYIKTMLQSSSSSLSPTRPVQQQWWSWWSSSDPPSPHIISGEAELLMATVRFALIGVCYICEIIICGALIFLWSQLNHEFRYLKSLFQDMGMCMIS